MAQRRLRSVLLVSSFLSPSVAAQEPLTPWRNDAQQLAAALDAVPALDIHTHLLQPGELNTALDDRFAPLLMRSTHPWLPSLLRARSGLTIEPADERRGMLLIRVKEFLDGRP